MLVFKIFLLASICSLAQPPLIEYGRGSDLVNMFEHALKRLDLATGKLNHSLESPTMEIELIENTLSVEREYKSLLAIQKDAKLFSSMLRARTNSLYRAGTIHLQVHRENLDLAVNLERIAAREFSHVEQKIIRAAETVRRLSKKTPTRTRSARSGFSLFHWFSRYPENPFIAT